MKLSAINFSKKILPGVQVFFATLFVLIIAWSLLCVFLGGLNKLLLAVITVSLIAVIAVFYLPKNKNEKINRPKELRVLFIASLLLLVVQCALISTYVFSSDWDVSIIAHSVDTLLSGKNLEGYDLWYFSMYYNNRLILILFYLFAKIGSIFGIENYAMSAIFVQCLLSQMAGIMLWLLTKKILKNRYYTWISWVLFQILVAFSPWLSIPYSDAMGLIFPIAILYLYTLTDTDNRRIKIIAWTGIGLISSLGIQIKPQTIIVLIAIIIHQLLFIANKKINKTTIRNGVIIAACFAVSFFASLFLTKTVIERKIKFIDNVQVPMTHYFMMGMNTKTKGRFNQDDLEMTSKMIFERYENKGSKINVPRQNISEAIRRIKAMGIKGFVAHMSNKTEGNYGDGTFSWGGEGKFFYKISPATNDLQKFIRGFVYRDGKNHVIFKTWFNFIWITVLILSIFSIKLIRSKYISTSILAIIGLSLFELIFEARARYLFTYVPIYILLAIAGLSVVANKIKNSKLHDMV